MCFSAIDRTMAGLAARDPLREVARYAAAGIDDQEHDPPYLHGLPFGHRLVGILR